MKHNVIYNTDCLDVLRRVAYASVDVCFADPPFNLGKKYASSGDAEEFYHYINWCEQWLIELVRITKPSGSILIHNIPKTLIYYADILNCYAHFKHWISWDAPTGFVGKKLQASHYGVLYYAKNVKEHKSYAVRHPHKRCRKCSYLLKDYGGKKNQIHPFGPIISDVWTDLHRLHHRKDRDEHPCQLPIPLMERLILMCSDEGDIIYDPFMGTGATAVAALNLGRRYLGSEISPEYCEIADKNISEKVKQATINGAHISRKGNKILTLRDCDWDKISNSFDIPENVKEVDSTEIGLE